MGRIKFILSIVVLVGGLAGCASVSYPPHFGQTDLPGILEVQTEYKFNITLPPRTTEVVYRWKRPDDSVVFTSAIVRPKTEILRTEVNFLNEGRYIFELIVKDQRGQIHTFRRIYLVQEVPSTYRRHIPRWIK